MYILGVTHISFAITAMVVGAVVVLRRKGTRSHRVVGWVYAVSMLGLNVTALMIYRLFGGFGPFHVAAIVSLITLFAGMYFVVARPTNNWLAYHYNFMNWSYVGLLAAAVSEFGTRVEGFQFWWAVLIGTAIVISVGARLIKKNELPVLQQFGRLATERVQRKPLFR